VGARARAQAASAQPSLQRGWQGAREQVEADGHGPHTLVQAPGLQRHGHEVVQSELGRTAVGALERSQPLAHGGLAGRVAGERHAVAGG
jgi:hypothetical protein